MRLDLVLKQSSLIKRRTIAKQLAENGKISINGKVAKPSSDVDDGDILTLVLGDKTVNVEISFIAFHGRQVPTYEVIKD